MRAAWGGRSRALRFEGGQQGHAAGLGTSDEPQWTWGFGRSGQRLGKRSGPLCTAQATLKGCPALPAKPGVRCPFFHRAVCPFAFPRGLAGAVSSRWDPAARMWTFARESYIEVLRALQVGMLLLGGPGLRHARGGGGGPAGGA